MSEERWPETLTDDLQRRFGRILHTRHLSGVAGADNGCTLVNFDGTSLIVKTSSSPREQSFYVHHADALRSAGVDVPHLIQSGTDEQGNYFIVIEHILRALPKEQWRHNSHQVEMLSRLHRATWGSAQSHIADPFRPRWTSDMTEHVLDWFARSLHSTEIRQQLLDAQTLWETLNFNQCCISGDPNPTNWCQRYDGSLVLVDWERFGYGTPAIDLAILLPGLGSDDGSAEAWLAGEYIAHWRQTELADVMDDNQLAAEIRLAKLWTVVEFVSNATMSRSKRDYPQETVTYMIGHLPEFLQMVTSEVSVLQ